MLKNRIFTILIMLSLLTPVYAETGVSPDLTEETVSQEFVQQNETTELEEVSDSPIQLEQEQFDKQTFKQPVSKRKIVKKFLFAMLGVVISSILLFVLLSLYNKLRASILNPNVQSGGDTSLVTPDNLTDAVKAYLEKTNWNK